MFLLGKSYAMQCGMSNPVLLELLDPVRQAANLPHQVVYYGGDGILLDVSVSLLEHDLLAIPVPPLASVIPLNGRAILPMKLFLPPRPQAGIGPAIRPSPVLP
jgi:hypothetical protein